MAHSVTSTKNNESIRITAEAYPRPLGDRIGNPAPLAMGGFATTLLTVSLAMMGFRGVSLQTVFVGNLCFVACVGLLISAQWAMIKGDTFTYTVLTAFALFYGGYGATLIPSWGIIDAYGGSSTPQYNNALGFFVLIWAVCNLFFLIASIQLNLVYICIFISIELCLVFDASSYFALADGKAAASTALMKAGGVFGFIAGLLGFYCVAYYLCQDVLPFGVPMGDTSAWFQARRERKRLQGSDA
ncbi:gpr1 family protein [Fusarium albosuccineum]|uniref:Gpr1 family protein n=1 Tax=Fusarium albosuccineum TaxID=1237068 RepID=A0A8H4LQA6_9HYPO|nr:gpr1 family protein [Fusarium albosuccineum]